MSEENEVTTAITELDEIIYGGLNNVASKGTSLGYRSVDDLMKVRRVLQNRQASSNNKNWRITANARHDKGV